MSADKWCPLSREPWLDEKLGLVLAQHVPETGEHTTPEQLALEPIHRCLSRGDRPWQARERGLAHPASQSRDARAALTLQTTAPDRRR